MQLENGDIDLVPSGTEFPEIPALCNDMVSDDVADLVEADNKYRECITKLDWLENELDDACDEAVFDLWNLIDLANIKLQDIKLRVD